jgi:hypothetical protein
VGHTENILVRSGNDTFPRSPTVKRELTNHNPLPSPGELAVLGRGLAWMGTEEGRRDQLLQGDRPQVAGVRCLRASLGHVVGRGNGLPLATSQAHDLGDTAWSLWPISQQEQAQPGHVLGDSHVTFFLCLHWSSSHQVLPQHQLCLCLSRTQTQDRGPISSAHNTIC